MQSKEYSAEVLRTAGGNIFLDAVPINLLHGAIGASGEASEILDAVKKSLFYNKPLDKTHLIEEIGDTLWYLSLALEGLNSSFEEAMDVNISKLKVRYPEQFDADKAINRDKEAEQLAMIRKF